MRCEPSALARKMCVSISLCSASMTDWLCVQTTLDPSGEGKTLETPLNCMENSGVQLVGACARSNPASAARSSAAFILDTISFLKASWGGPGRRAAQLKWGLAVLRFLAAIAVACAAPRPVLLTTDCGADIDDQWAIAHLVRSPGFDVRAIVTTHTGSHPILAAPAAETSARNAREVLEHVPHRKNPDVIPGSSVPLKSRSPLPNAGVARIISESRGF